MQYSKGEKTSRVPLKKEREREFRLMNNIPKLKNEHLVWIKALFY